MGNKFYGDRGIKAPFTDKDWEGVRLVGYFYEFFDEMAGYVGEG